MGAAAELTAYRIVQEALTNTLRHAEASRARVTIRYDAPRLELGVTDDGEADLPRNQSGHGIHGMHERAALHNGMVRAGPAPDGGWAVTATLRPETAAS
jgi:signal transduction histidine kinase